MKFRTKILLVFIVVFLFATVLATTIYYNYLSGVVEENYTENAVDSMEQLADAMEMSLDTMDQKVRSMLANPLFTTPITTWLNNPIDKNYNNALTNTADFFNDLEQSTSLLESAYLYTAESSFDDLRHLRRQNFTFEDSLFLERFLTGEDGTQWFCAMEDIIFESGTTVIPCVKKIYIESKRNTPIYLVLQLDREQLYEFVRDKYQHYDAVIIVDGEGNEIMSSGVLEDMESPDYITADESGVITSEELNKDYMIIQTEIETTGWQLLMFKNRDSLTRDLETLRVLVIGVAIALLAVGVLVISVLVVKLTDALDGLVIQMNRLCMGELDARYFYKRKDEIGKIAQSFNIMAERIEMLVEMQKQNIAELKKERDWVAEVQKQKRKAELRALQAQINPHFLYNTLNAITWEAADKGEEGISKLSSSLGKFFRLTLSKGAETIPLQDEAEHVRSYLSIQEIRYSNKLQYEIHIPKELEKVPVIKLILQPLVENSIYHGIKLKTGEGVVRIEAYEEEGNIYLTVTDDCSAVEQLGKVVFLVEGDEMNIKITTPTDLIIAEALLREREGR